jgi:hypothetical protein
MTKDAGPGVKSNVSVRFIEKTEKLWEELRKSWSLAVIQGFV